MANDMEKQCHGFHVNGDKNWRADVPNDASFYKLVDAASQVKLDPAGLMKYPEEFLKAHFHNCNCEV